VIVRFDRQLVAAAQTTALKNSAPIGGSHALTKAVHTHTAADLRLIRTFYHFSFLTLKIIAGIRCLPFNTGTTLYRKAFDSVNLDSALRIGLSASCLAET
jgi:hypothetical protein